MALKTGKSKFALFFGNRGFFPGSLIAAARDEVMNAVKNLGHDVLILDAAATRHGAVETIREGEIYSKFLNDHEGEFDGVILSLPNFGDENGAVAALQDAGVPILIQAYPDELNKMAPEVRRDSFCGKLSVMDYFCQSGIKFTALKPHTVSPSSEAFKQNVNKFDSICRTVRNIRRMRIGAIGARTSPFKTVRIDEITLQRHGITVETFDLSDIFSRMRNVDKSTGSYRDKSEQLKAYTNFAGVPEDSFDNIVRLGVVLDAVIAESQLDAIAVRCWTEIQEQMKISPCVVMSELNNRGIAAACEVDVGNAVAMSALANASGGVPACLDWNNNYKDEENKCILFHCGPVPQSMMAGIGNVTEHAIIGTSVGPGCSYGCNTGRIRPMDFTYSSLLTDSGRIRMFIGQGHFTGEPIPNEFFGCAGVASIPNLQDVLLYIGKNGHRHHVSITEGEVADSLNEAMGYYLGYDVDVM